MEHITIDPTYHCCAPDDFPAMLEVDRYGKRSSAFDKIISATHDHFWDPTDSRYVDFSVPFDVENEMIMPETLNLELRTAVADRLNEKQKVRLVNGTVHFTLSSILHGEQAALNLSANLCHILLDPGAQEYAANQAREEARHVAGFTRYIQTRFGKPTPMDPFLQGLITDMVLTPLVWKKIVGLQMVLEGLAMGLFANFYQFSNDPLLTRLLQFTMTDEAFHHKFGKIWADKTVPHLPEGACRSSLPSPRPAPTAIPGPARHKGPSSAQSHYAAFVDLKELHAEGDKMVGDDIAEEGIKFLKAINEGKDPATLAAAE